MVNQIVTVKQTFRILMLTFFACFIRKQKFWVEWNELIRVSLWLGVTVQGCALTRICHMSKNNLEDFQLDLFPVTYTQNTKLLGHFLLAIHLNLLIIGWFN